MLHFLARRWFLLVLGAGVGLALVRPGWVRPWLDPLSPQAVVATSLFLTSWGLESRSLYRALVRPGPALWALAVSYGALPALAWAAGPLLSLPDLRVGLLLITSVPCTLASAVLWTRLGGGNEAVALLVVVLSTALSWLATTFWLTRAAGARVAPDTAGMMHSLALVLILPVALGQLGRTAPALVRAATRCRAVIGVVARLLICAIILKAVMGLSGREVGPSAGPSLLAATLCGVIHLAALFLGLGGSRALGFARADGIAVAFAGSQKTLSVSLFLFEAYYQKMYPLAVLPLVFYHVGQFILDTFVAEHLAGREERCRGRPFPLTSPGSGDGAEGPA
jgi:sodium/bile acid cotransporter 7